jgi:hypothetical protein
LKEFQSLKGFQPKWNDLEIEGETEDESVSIPKRVSAKVERLIHDEPDRVYAHRFQSLKGFQPKWNPSALLEEGTLSSVSIPKRVSAKVEPYSPARKSIADMFQSLKGFQPKWNPPYPSIESVTSMFQSLKGFQPKWNLIVCLSSLILCLCFNP